MAILFKLKHITILIYDTTPTPLIVSLGLPYILKIVLRIEGDVNMLKDIKKATESENFDKHYNTLIKKPLTKSPIIISNISNNKNEKPQQVKR